MMFYGFEWINKITFTSLNATWYCLGWTILKCLDRVKLKHKDAIYNLELFVPLSDYNIEDETEQLRASVDFLVELCENVSSVKVCHTLPFFPILLAVTFYMLMGIHNLHDLNVQLFGR